MRYKWLSVSLDFEIFELISAFLPPVRNLKQPKCEHKKFPRKATCDGSGLTLRVAHEAFSSLFSINHVKLFIAKSRHILTTTEIVTKCDLIGCSDL